MCAASKAVAALCLPAVTEDKAARRQHGGRQIHVLPARRTRGSRPSATKTERLDGWISEDESMNWRQMRP